MSEVTQRASHISAKDHTMMEIGHIHFFYRPKVGIEDVTKFDQIQRLYIALVPMNGVPCLLAIPKKVLPIAHKHKKHLAFVDFVSPNVDEIIAELGEKTYESKKKANKVRPRSRVLATGVYGLYSHGDHTHLAYVLEYPETVTNLHKQFNLECEGSYIVSVKNPKLSASSYLSKNRRPNFPESLQEQFNKKRWTPLHPDFLKYPGAEIVLIGLDSSEHEDTGEVKELEELADAEVKCTTTEDMFKNIRADKHNLPLDPLEGRLV